MSSFDRYIIAEITKPLLAVLVIIAVLFASFSAARYLAEGITEILGVAMMLKLTGLKTLIALEVLVPIAFYLSIVIGLGRLYRDQEIIALRAAGVRSLHIAKSVLLLAVPIALVVGMLSIAGRPWAYAQSYILDARAKADLNTNRFQPGRFYGNEDKGRVIYIQEKDKTGGMHRIFHYLNKDDSNEFILASQARQLPSEGPRGEQIELLDGVLYRLQKNGAGDELSRFDRFVYYLDDPRNNIGYKRKAAATTELLRSEDTMDIAERQWRLSRPLAVIVLALIAVPLSRSAPRQGKNEKIFTAALIFAVYYNLSGLARTWVEQGVVEAFPGLWWLQVLMLTLAVVLLLPDLRGKFTR